METTPDEMKSKQKVSGPFFCRTTRSWKWQTVFSTESFQSATRVQIHTRRDKHTQSLTQKLNGKNTERKYKCKKILISKCGTQRFCFPICWFNFGLVVIGCFFLTAASGWYTALLPLLAAYMRVRVYVSITLNSHVLRLSYLIAFVCASHLY